MYNSKSIIAVAVVVVVVVFAVVVVRSGIHRHGKV